MSYFPSKVKLRATALSIALFAVFGCGQSNTQASLQDTSVLVEEVVEDSFNPDLAYKEHQALFAELLPPSVQHFVVPKGKRKKIIGTHGIAVEVIPEALETESGQPVHGAIEVAMVEVMTPLDFIKNSASTLSDGKLLESGGSVHLEMRSQGKKLRIKAGKSLPIEFPQTAINENMELFYGQRDRSTGMNWIPADAPLRPTSPDLTKKRKAVPGSPEQAQATYPKESSEVAYVASQMVKRMPALPDIPKTYQGQRLCRSCIEAPENFQSVFFPRGLDTNEWQIMTQKEEFIVLQNFRDGGIYTFAAEDVDAKTNTRQMPVPQADYRAREVDSAQRAEWQARHKMQETVQTLVAESINKSRSLRGSIIQLGWINCDRFNLRPLVPVEFECPPDLEAGGINLLMYLPNSNSYISRYMLYFPEKGAKISTDLPINAEVVPLLYTMRKDEVLVAEPTLTKVPVSKITLQLNFKAFGLEAFKDLLELKYGQLKPLAAAS